MACCGGRWWLQAVDSFFPLVFPCFSLFFFFFFFSCSSNLSSSLGLLVFSFFRSFPLSFSCSPFVLSPSVFIGKTEGERGRGDHCAATSQPPKWCIPSVFLYLVVGHRSELRQVGCFGSASFWWFGRKRERVKQGRKDFFFPCLARPGEQERLHCRSKRHRFELFASFLMNSVCNDAVLEETHRFI